MLVELVLGPNEADVDVDDVVVSELVDALEIDDMTDELVVAREADMLLLVVTPEFVVTWVAIVLTEVLKLEVEIADVVADDAILETVMVEELLAEELDVLVVAISDGKDVAVVVEIVPLKLIVLDSDDIVITDWLVTSSDVDEVGTRLVSCGSRSSSFGSLDASTLLAQSVAATAPTVTFLHS